MCAPIFQCTYFFLFGHFNSELLHISLIKWDYENDKNVNHERFILNCAHNLWGGVKFGSPER